MSSFQQLISGKKPVLVDFHATWCGPCKSMAPDLQKFAKEMTEQVHVLKVDVDQNPAAAQAYRIQGVPTLILFKEGKVVWRASGAHSYFQLKQAVSPHIL